MNRVAVTGMGLVTSLGTEYQDVFARLLRCESGIESLPFETASRVGGRIPDHFDPAPYISPTQQRTLDPYSTYGLYAAHRAMEDAGLSEYDPEMCCVVVGSGIGGLQEIYANVKRSLEGKKTYPFFIPKVLSNMLAGHISTAFQFYGSSHGVVSACATGAHAIGNAMRMIQHGEADIVICGGSEAAIHPVGVSGFCSAGALSTSFNDRPTEASRPWDRQRDGFVISDGAALLVLESEEHAEKRGARVHAFLRGYGSSADAYHITTPPADGRGAKLAIQKALKDGGLEPNHIGYINAHATSTPIGDEIELRAIYDLFGNRPKVSSTKSATGHLLGAAGSLEAILTILALQQQTLPPTLNLEEPDMPEGVSIDLIPHEPQHVENVQYALSNSFGFGGTNASLIFEKAS